MYKPFDENFEYSREMFKDLYAQLEQRLKLSLGEYFKDFNEMPDLLRNPPLKPLVAETIHE